MAKDMVDDTDCTVTIERVFSVNDKQSALETKLQINALLLARYQ